MSLASILSQAKENQAAYNRKGEIERLDLNPEEYQFLRDDKSALGIDLMEAILEKMPDCGWSIDSSTMRFIKISGVEPANPLRRTQNQLAIALTSNTKRFFVKIFRDYPELDSFYDLVNCLTVIVAIRCINIEINDIEEARTREAERVQHEARLAEQRKLEEAKRQQEEECAAIEMEMREIRAHLATISAGEIRTHRLAATQLDILVGDIKAYCAALPVEELRLYLDQENASTFEYKIVDDVPCRTIVDDQKFLATLVSTENIFPCIEFKNLVELSANSCELDRDRRLLTLTCSRRTVPIIAKALEGVGHILPRSNIIFLTLKQDDDLSGQLKTVADSVQRSLPQLAAGARNISVFGTVFVDGSNREILAAVTAEIDRLATNVATIVWDAKSKP